MTILTDKLEQDNAYINRKNRVKQGQYKQQNQSKTMIILIAKKEQNNEYINCTNRVKQ